MRSVRDADLGVAHAQPGPVMRHPGPMSYRFSIVGLVGLALGLSGCAGPKDPEAVLQQRVSQDPAAMMRIGEVAEASQDWAGADAFYRRASELAPDLASASLAHARMMARQGDLEGALGSRRAAHGLHGDDARITTALGRMLVTVKRPSEALAVFEDGLRVDPTSVALLVGKGVALDGLGRHAEAQAAYEASLKLDPDNGAAKRDLELSSAMARQPRRP